jgi:hypothetical protein
VTCETTGLVLTSDGLPTIYVSGDNVSREAVADIANRSGPIDVAVLFGGAARLPSRQNGHTSQKALRTYNEPSLMRASRRSLG